jgi:hypothetical protein
MDYSVKSGCGKDNCTYLMRRSESTSSTNVVSLAYVEGWYGIVESGGLFGLVV